MTPPRARPGYINYATGAMYDIQGYLIPGTGGSPYSSRGTPTVGGASPYSGPQFSGTPAGRGPAGPPGTVGTEGVPALPPFGTYDPALDAQRRSVKRGLADLMADTALRGQRTTDDYEIGVSQLESQQKQTVEDLTRQYQVQGQRQTIAARQMGVADGGTAAASKAARAKNKGRSEDRIEQNFDQRLGALALGYGRSQTDAQLAQTRAQREAGFYGIDNANAAWAQYGQSGMAESQATQVTINGKPFLRWPDGTLVPAPVGF